MRVRRIKVGSRAEAKMPDVIAASELGRERPGDRSNVRQLVYDDLTSASYSNARSCRVDVKLLEERQRGKDFG